MHTYKTMDTNRCGEGKARHATLEFGEGGTLCITMRRHYHYLYVFLKLNL